MAGGRIITDLPGYIPAFGCAGLPLPSHLRKVSIRSWSDFGLPDYKPEGFNVKAAQDFRKNSGGSWFNIAHNTDSGVGRNPDGRKLPGNNSEKQWSDRPIQRLCDSQKVPGFRFDGSGRSFQTASVKQSAARETAEILQAAATRAVHQISPGWRAKHYDETDKMQLAGVYGSKSNSRKAASAQIARIPFALSRHIARVYKP